MPPCSLYVSGRHGREVELNSFAGCTAPFVHTPFLHTGGENMGSGETSPFLLSLRRKELKGKELSRKVETFDILLPFLPPIHCPYSLSLLSLLSLMSMSLYIYLYHHVYVFMPGTHHHCILPCRHSSMPWQQGRKRLSISINKSKLLKSLEHLWAGTPASGEEGCRLRDISVGLAFERGKNKKGGGGRGRRGGAGQLPLATCLL